METLAFMFVDQTAGVTLVRRLQVDVNKVASVVGYRVWVVESSSIQL